MNQKISLRQYELKGDSNIGRVSKDISIDPYDVSPWHQGDSSIGTLIQLKCDDVTDWSFRGFDINEIGITDLMLPSKMSEGFNTIIAHIDIRIASPKDNCAVIVFISASSISDESGMASISIKNESDEHITVFQANVGFDPNDRGNYKGSMRSQFVVYIFYSLSYTHSTYT